MGDWILLLLYVWFDDILLLAQAKKGSVNSRGQKKSISVEGDKSVI